jgi:hypothetical protein
MSNWFFKIVKVAGASFPVTASFVQLQGQLDADSMNERLKKLEDPISFLHEDVQKLSKLFYEDIKRSNEPFAVLEYEDPIYEEFSRPIAALKSEGLIECQGILGRHLPTGIVLSDPSYVMYLCALFEESAKMDLLIEKLEDCKPRETLDGREIAQSLNLGLMIVKAVFEIYEAKEYGMMPKGLGMVSYMGKA